MREATLGAQDTVTGCVVAVLALIDTVTACLCTVTRPAISQLKRKRRVGGWVQLRA